MHVTAHAIARLSERLGHEADRIIDRLEAMPGEPGDVAIEVHRVERCARCQHVYLPHGLPFGTTACGWRQCHCPGWLQPAGVHQTIAIARDGSIETVMFRRSWNQPFTPFALDVDRVLTLVAGG